MTGPLSESNFHNIPGLSKPRIEQHGPARDPKPLFKNSNPSPPLPESESAFGGNSVILAMKMKAKTRPSSKSRRFFVFVIK